MQGQSTVLNTGTFIADIASGCLYAMRSGEDANEASAWLESLRKPALAIQGYTVVMDMPDALQGKIEQWGYQPESLDMMKKLKARWDPNGGLHAGLFAEGM
jgi:D-lactate dehydrogenase (cytochrome)